MRSQSDYEKARQEAYAPLVERVHEDWKKDVFVFAISCGLGWKEILFKLTGELDAIWEGYQGKKGRDCWQLCQAKEKFGGLRFYVDYPEHKSEDAERRYQKSRNTVDSAEADAGMTCERCGKPGHLAGKGYIATVCDECEKRWKERGLAGAWPTLFG